MEKKNDKKKYIILGLLAFGAIGSYFVSGTYAKYTSTASGKATAKAAKWSFEVNNVEIATLEEKTDLTINLFNSIKEDDLSGAEADTSNLLAPGTGGSFDIAVKNTSQVTVDYIIALSDLTNESNIPVEFSTDKKTWTTEIDDITYEGTGLAAGATATNATTVYWRWKYEDTTDVDTRDAADTKIGISARTADEGKEPALTVKVEVIATQAN